MSAGLFIAALNRSGGLEGLLFDLLWNRFRPVCISFDQRQIVAFTYKRERAQGFPDELVVRGNDEERIACPDTCAFASRHTPDPSGQGRAYLCDLASGITVDTRHQRALPDRRAFRQDAARHARSVGGDRIWL